MPGKTLIRNGISWFLLKIDCILEFFGRSEDKSLAVKFLVWWEFSSIMKQKQKREQLRNDKIAKSNQQYEDLKTIAFERLKNEQ